MSKHDEFHLVTLEHQHKELDKKIDGLEKSGVFEDEHLQGLKKQRLHLRDEIAKIKNTEV
jgi:uncharacterized protein YdcH (DUF465 family)